MRDTLNDYETIKAELELYKTGKVVPFPVDKEHARMMLIIAMSYLEIKPEAIKDYEANLAAR